MEFTVTTFRYVYYLYMPPHDALSLRQVNKEHNMNNPLISARRKVLLPYQLFPARKKTRRMLNSLQENKQIFYARASMLAGLFPDEIVIQAKSITVVHNGLFESNDETMPVKDVGRVIASNTLMFCALDILGKNPNHVLHIKGLRNKDSKMVKDCIEGLLLEEPTAVEESVLSAEQAQTPSNSHLANQHIGQEALHAQNASSPETNMSVPGELQ